MALNTPNFYHPMFGGQYGDDPLGIALQDRAMQQRQAQHLDEMEGDINHRMIGGPLPDPRWEGLFQAMNERGIRRASLGGGTAALGSTAYPAFQQAADESSNNIATPFRGRSLDQRADLGTHLLPGYGGPDQALAGLKASAPQGYLTHDEWMSQNEPQAPGQWAIRKTTIPGGAYRRSTARPVVSSPLNQFSRYQRPNPNE